MSPFKRIVLWLATAAVSLTLCVAVLALVVTGYVARCDRLGRDVDPRLARLAIVRWAFERADYRALLRAMESGRAGRFETTWDFDTTAHLGREQFDAVTMYGQPRFRRRPNIRVDDFAVWTGLRTVSFIAVESPAVGEALARCRVVRRISFETDGLGFKTTDFVRTPGKRSVLFLGDSFTEGMHVRSQDTFVNLFGHMLEQAGIDAVPVNAGVGGYGALEEAFTAETYSRPVEASLVVESLYLNDVNGDPRRVMMEGRVPPGSYHEMFASLARLAHHCAEDGVALVVCVIPDKEQFPRGRQARHFQDRVRSWCAAHDVPFVDAFPYLKQHGAEANYFTWDPHLNEQGHRAVATLLFERLRPQLDARFHHRG